MHVLLDTNIILNKNYQKIIVSTSNKKGCKCDKKIATEAGNHCFHVEKWTILIEDAYDEALCPKEMPVSNIINEMKL